MSIWLVLDLFLGVGLFVVDVGGILVHAIELGVVEFLGLVAGGGARGAARPDKDADACLVRADAARAATRLLQDGDLDLAAVATEPNQSLQDGVLDGLA